ncbi:Uncharacterized protein ChrSV_0582 [Chromobacterium vaccinii]|nr:Uncharacterized protein ChrSW_0582 [Chromobacterium vaccinii]QND88041.1 Uncharacterized protein ChrSV_0582 [Chromobacterium vaccinii]
MGALWRQFEAYFADFVAGARDGRYVYSEAHGSLASAEDVA